MLEIIGAGFGRTGTLALKLALERLGFGPCHHMMEVFGHPEQVPHWHAAARGEAVDWEALLTGYRAAVDWPSCAFWRELAEVFPEARVLLSVREPARWYASARDTIVQVMRRPVPDDAPPAVHAHMAMTRELILEGTFGGRFDDEAHACAVFEAHSRAVIDAVPAERLLVYQVSEGWAPLCGFLDRPVPDEPFPRVNSREEFQTRLAQMP